MKEYYLNKIKKRAERNALNLQIVFEAEKKGPDGQVNRPVCENERFSGPPPSSACENPVGVDDDQAELTILDRYVWGAIQ